MSLGTTIALSVVLALAVLVAAGTIIEWLLTR